MIFGFSPRWFIGLLLPVLSLVPPALWPDIFAQSNLQFEHVSAEYPLSNDAVYAITQDRHGFIWIGTEDGLNRFDGNEMVVFRHNPADPGSISFNWLRSLHEDSTGRIWVGHNNGLDRLDPQSNSFQPLLEMENLAGLGARGGHFDQNGNLWIVGLNDLFRLNTATQQLDTVVAGLFSQLEYLAVRDIVAEKNGRIWVGGTNERLYFENYELNGLTEEVFWTLFEDDQGFIWIGTEKSGLFRLDPITRETRRYLYDPKGNFYSGNSIIDTDCNARYH